MHCGMFSISSLGMFDWLLIQEASEVNNQIYEFKFQHSNLAKTFWEKIYIYGYIFFELKWNQVSFINI